MNLRALTIVFVRLIAIWLLFLSLSAGEQFAVHFFTQHESYDSASRFFSLIALFNLVVYLIISFFLLTRSHSISKFILPSNYESGTDIVVTPRDLAIVSFSVVGLVYFINGLEALGYTMATLIFSPKDSFDQRIPVTFEKSQMIVAVIKTVIGFLLFWGSSGLVKLLHWAKEAGISKKDV